MKKLGFGLMRLPCAEGNTGRVDLDTVKRMADTFLERGFTYFDTAYVYHDGRSEEVFREAVTKRYPRSSFTLATKLPMMVLKREEEQERIFNEQLERTGLEYFDYYLLHNLGAESYRLAEKLHSFAFAAQKKQEGRAKKIGFSFHDNAALLDKILTEHPEVDFVQLQINYLDWENEGIQSRLCYETAVRHGKPVIVMEPVKGGTLARVPAGAEAILKACNSEASVPSWAIRYAASLDNVFMVLSGMSDPAQLNDNTSFMREFQPLTARERKALEEALAVIQGTVSVPCTSCGYCVAGCPKKIPIPQYFSLYNTEKLVGNNGFSIQKAYYGNLSGINGKASDCIGCKACERACPQHLKISGLLRDVAEAFE